MTNPNHNFIIIGAGAAGLFCASLLGNAGFNVTVLDNGKKIARKILMSGGGFCNFTNLYIEPKKFISANPHFCKSALKRFTQWDFLALVNDYKIAYHEKEEGQLFCDNSAKDVVNMLYDLCNKAGVIIKKEVTVNDVILKNNIFNVDTNIGLLCAKAVIVASGGLSLPRLGTTPIGYKIAEQFGLNVVPVKAGLVPFTLHQNALEHFSKLAGVAVYAEVTTANTCFKNNILFTHRGLSGPAILQLSSYWQAGNEITINLLPDVDFVDALVKQKKESNQHLKTFLGQFLPKRLIELFIELNLIVDAPLKQLTNKNIEKINDALTNWKITPNGTEGYRTAEVTLGGVDTNDLSSKTMQAKNVENLYFIGEVIDVTGWLGGYNFQWAWSSAYACASEIINSKNNH